MCERKYSRGISGMLSDIYRHSLRDFGTRFYKAFMSHCLTEGKCQKDLCHYKKGNPYLILTKRRKHSSLKRKCHENGGPITLSLLFSTAPIEYANCRVWAGIGSLMDTSLLFKPSPTRKSGFWVGATLIPKSLPQPNLKKPMGYNVDDKRYYGIVQSPYKKLKLRLISKLIGWFMQKRNFLTSANIWTRSCLTQFPKCSIYAGPLIIFVTIKSITEHLYWMYENEGWLILLHLMTIHLPILPQLPMEKRDTIVYMTFTLLSQCNCKKNTVGLHLIFLET